MNHRNSGTPEVQVVLNNIRSEIELDGVILLKLLGGQPGLRVMCTGGTLWLTQSGDPHDHILKAGQSFTLYQQGTVLVQGLPNGKATRLDIAEVPIYHYNQTPGGRRWTQFLNRLAL